MVRSKQDMIDEVMDHFDFHRVQQVMQATNWIWVGTDFGVPTEPEIRVQARGLLNRAFETGYIATGGFSAEYDRSTDSLSLNFEVTRYSTLNGVL